jgi:hypothetical protein
VTQRNKHLVKKLAKEVVRAIIDYVEGPGPKDSAIMRKLARLIEPCILTAFAFGKAEAFNSLLPVVKRLIKQKEHVK